LLTFPTVLMLLVMRHWFFARTYLQVLLQISIGMIPYTLGLTWAIWTGRVWRVRQDVQRPAEEQVAVPLVGTERG
jgi:hypothetical protein